MAEIYCSQYEQYIYNVYMYKWFSKVSFRRRIIFLDKI